MGASDDWDEDDADALAFLVGRLLAAGSTVALDDDLLKDMIDDALDTPPDLKAQAQSAGFGAGRQQSSAAPDVAKVIIDALVPAPVTRRALDHLFERGQDSLAAATLADLLPKSLRAGLADALQAHLAALSRVSAQLKPGLPDAVRTLVEGLRQ